jgi:intracellular sulfur oxidation DsrE/DsrF family protein
MATNDFKPTTDRRRFLGSIASGAAAVGLATLSPLQQVQASPHFLDNPDDPAELVFKNLKGKHRIVFDVTEPNGMMPFAWPRVFLLTNMATGTAEKDNNVVVILRHDAIPYAMQDTMWSKYSFGDMFKINDAATNKGVIKNPFWKPAKGTYKIPGFGEVQIGINELQDSGVQFVVCNAAMTVHSAVTADKLGVKHEDVLNEWKANLIPGVTVVPSGVWAVGRAQENKCAYCFAG